jgi:glutaredoxin
MGCQSADKQKDHSENSFLESAERVNVDIIVYGSETCPHCLVLLRKMEEEGIPHQFKEVDNSDVNFREMYEKIKKINYQGYVNYPVVDVKGLVLVAPEFEQIRELLERK